jgi:hypothetical protein
MLGHHWLYYVFLIHMTGVEDDIPVIEINNVSLSS